MRNRITMLFFSFLFLQKNPQKTKKQKINQKKTPNQACTVRNQRVILLIWYTVDIALLNKYYICFLMLYSEWKRNVQSLKKNIFIKVKIMISVFLQIKKKVLHVHWHLKWENCLKTIIYQELEFTLLTTMFPIYTICICVQKWLWCLSSSQCFERNNYLSLNIFWFYCAYLNF